MTICERPTNMNFPAAHMHFWAVRKSICERSINTSMCMLLVCIFELKYCRICETEYLGISVGQDFLVLKNNYLRAFCLFHLWALGIFSFYSNVHICELLRIICELPVDPEDERRREDRSAGSERFFIPHFSFHFITTKESNFNSSSLDLLSAP